MTYTPTPGTTPYRVIELLQGSDELTSAQIAAELDVDAKQLQQFMKTAVAHGAVVAEKRDSLLRWRIGNGTPPAPPPDREPDDEPIVQHVVPASPAPATPRPAAEPPGKQARKQVRQPRAGHAAPGSSERAAVAEIYRQGALAELQEQVTPAPAMRCAVWSDGALSIERAGQRMDLTVDESRSMLQMLRVVDRTLGGEADA